MNFNSEHDIIPTASTGLHFADCLKATRTSQQTLSTLLQFSCLRPCRTSQKVMAQTLPNRIDNT